MPSHTSVATDAAHVAGDVLRRHFGALSGVRAKGPHDLVSAADLEAGSEPTTAAGLEQGLVPHPAQSGQAHCQRASRFQWAQTHPGHRLKKARAETGLPVSAPTLPSGDGTCSTLFRRRLLWVWAGTVYPLAQQRSWVCRLAETVAGGCGRPGWLVCPNRSRSVLPFALVRSSDFELHYRT